MENKQFLALILPLTALVIIPAILLFDFKTKTFPLHFDPLLASIGALLCVGGLGLMAETIRALHKVGTGTIAPWNPPINLVTSGLYAYVRNPMIGGACLVLLGESLVFRSEAIGTYLFIFFVLNSMYFKFIEEPALEKRFGQNYQEYKKKTPMWLPKKPSEKKSSN